MSLPYKKELIPRAKNLRKNATRQENRLWYDFLRNFSSRFQRQKVISGFIADFYCASAKLIVEIDGSQHYSEQGMAYDGKRSAMLDKYGVEVIRFSNADIDQRFESVCEAIRIAVERRKSNDL